MVCEYMHDEHELQVSAIAHLNQEGRTIGRTMGVLGFYSKHRSGSNVQSRNTTSPPAVDLSKQTSLAAHACH